ncbi:MAG: DnaJ domain-containing protein [Pseudomonadota bacterium]
MNDLYAILGVEADASDTVVKAAYRRKAAAFHPDRNVSADAAIRFREVQEAYEILSDAEKRQAFDENRRRSLLDNPLETAKQLWQTYLNRVLH